MVFWKLVMVAATSARPSSLFAGPAARNMMSRRPLKCNALLVKLPKQFLERVRDFTQLVGLVIPPIHRLGVAIRLWVGQKNKLVTATVTADGNAPGWKPGRSRAKAVSRTMSLQVRLRRFRSLSSKIGYSHHPSFPVATSPP